MPPTTRHSTLTTSYKCFACGKVPDNADPALISCGGCKGPRYCNSACQKAHKAAHKPDCNTIQHLLLPIRPAGLPRYISLRTKASTKVAQSPDTMFHLRMRTPRTCGPESVRYLGVSLNLDAVKEKMWETVDRAVTAMPGRNFLETLLEGTAGGMAGVSEVRVPMKGGSGEMMFWITVEEGVYIQDCVRRSLWSGKKMLYTVVTETLKYSRDEHEVKKDDKQLHPRKTTTGKPRRIVTDIKVAGTFPSEAAARAVFNKILRAWEGRVAKRGRGIALVERDGKYLKKGVRYDDKGGEIACVRIVTQDLLSAGAKMWKGVNGDGDVAM